MNESVWILLAELVVVIAAIYMGTRTSGIGLGVWGLVGVAVLVLVFGEAPGNAPVDAVFIVITVITAASVMQAAGGIEWMVSVAAKVIRRRPKSVVFLAPAMPRSRRWPPRSGSSARRCRRRRPRWSCSSLPRASTSAGCC